MNILVIHCVKIVRIRSYSGPYFPAFRLNTELGATIISKQPCWLIVSCHYSYAMYLTHLDTVYQSCHSVYHHFSLLNNIFKKQHFYKQHQAEIDKKSSTKIRQHHEAERFLFEKFYLKNCLFSLFTLLFKNDRKLSKKCAKKTSASVLMRLYD